MNKSKPLAESPFNAADTPFTVGQEVYIATQGTSAWHITHHTKAVVQRITPSGRVIVEFGLGTRLRKAFIARGEAWLEFGRTPYAGRCSLRADVAVVDALLARERAVLKINRACIDLKFGGELLRRDSRWSKGDYLTALDKLQRDVAAIRSLVNALPEDGS